MNTSNETGRDFDVSDYPALPQLKGVFVTGTDTGVGKTLVAGAVLRYLRGRGIRVEPFKPAATGCRRFRGELVSADAQFLAACADSRRMLHEIAPVRFRHALAPNVAARLEKSTVKLEEIFHQYRRLEGIADAVVVEGVGGLLCPITDDFLVAHFAKMVNLPVVIVARPGLGTINHTLLTLFAVRKAGLKVAGVVINRYEVDTASKGALAGQPFDCAPFGSEPQGRRQGKQGAFTSDAYLAIQTNPEEIASLGNVSVLALLPDERENSVEDATIGQDTEYVIAQVDWEGIISN